LALVTYNYLELAREQGMKTSLSHEDGAAQCTYLLNGVNENTAPPVSQLSGFASYLAGGVTNLHNKTVLHTVPEGGKIIRRLPKLHPFEPTLSAAGVASIAGVGKQTEANSLPLVGVPAVTEQFTHFTAYEYLVEFRKRRYFLLPDELIERPSATYYPPDGSEGKRYYYAEEWKRFTERTLVPAPDTVNATTGAAMKFRTASGAAPTGNQYPNNVALYLENQLLEVTWYMVPYRYFFPATLEGVTYKPYLTRFVNRVNQRDWWGFPKGSLMYLGATPSPFIPMTTNVLQFLGVGLSQSQDLLCNVKLRFLYTAREGTDVPTTGNGLANLNNIPAGHNLQPRHTDRKFYYTTTEDPANPADTTKWFASYPSFPIELLFTDPLLIQPDGPID
jgi:hypothetical protein